MIWYSSFFKNFPQFVVIHTVKGLNVVNKTEGDVFLEFYCFFDDPTENSRDRGAWWVAVYGVKLVLEKAEEPETKLTTSTGSSIKHESFKETSISALLTMPKPLTVWITINCGKF